MVLNLAELLEYIIGEYLCNDRKFPGHDTKADNRKKKFLQILFTLTTT